MTAAGLTLLASVAVFFCVCCLSIFVLSLSVALVNKIFALKHQFHSWHLFACLKCKFFVSVDRILHVDYKTRSLDVGLYIFYFYRCTCGCCEILPSFVASDCLCCSEIDVVAGEVDRQGLGSRCITVAADYEAAILNPATLYISWQFFTERWRQQAKSFGARNNE